MIRHVEDGDINDVVRFNRQAAKWVGDKDRTFFERYAALPHFLVLEDEGEPAAFLLAMNEDVDYDSPNFLWFQERYERFCYVDRVVVDDSRKRQGLGRRLYEYVMQHKGPPPLVCEVCFEPENTESIRFHETLGFQAVGTLTSGGKTCRMYLHS